MEHWDAMALKIGISLGLCGCQKFVFPFQQRFNNDSVFTFSCADPSTSLSKM